MSELKPGEYLVTRADLQRVVACRGCGASMAWIETAVGRRMPLSVATAREVPCDACAHLRQDGATPRGPCFTCRSTGTLYVVLNHWADCPDRQRFARKPKAGPSTEGPAGA